jgi:hypothetical protein
MAGGTPLLPEELQRSGIADLGPKRRPTLAGIKAKMAA